ncbi:HEPN domain-containing protein [candidate division KSB1 bacterium]|nr:HEPN domain-containing protein [candidate division KSB1 bacterium]
MHVLTQEWVDKAEGDFHTANREMRVRKAPNYDAVCFHCQQCVEKYLKAYLQEHGQRFRPVHDLIEFLELCLPYDSAFELQRDLLKELTKYAVGVRYPGESATKDDARAAIQSMKTVRAFLRQKLGLPEEV